MNTVTVLYLCIAGALGAPASPETNARRALPAIYHQEIHDDFGQYALRYVTAEGITYEERGRLVPDPDSKDYVLIYEGEYSFIGDDGKTYKTTYSTDIVNGYKVQADHLPYPPELEDVKEEGMVSEVASTTGLSKSTEDVKSEVAKERAVSDFPLEQHDEQAPKYPDASASA